MIAGILDSIKLERAKYCRELEYVREMANEDEIADRMDAAESQYIKETADDYEEAFETAEEIPTDDSDAESEELQRIMESAEDLTFDQMIGVVK